PVATGSRRRLVLKPSQKVALQALFQQNPYPGIATRERLARELGVDESRVQLKASGGLSPEKEFSLFAPRSGFKTNVEDGQSRAGRRLNTCAKKGKGANVYAQATVATSPTSVFLSREELARQTGIPEPRIQVSSPASARAQDVAQEQGGFRPAKRLELDTRPRDSFAENGPAEVALGLTDQRPGGRAGCRTGAAARQHDMVSKPKSSAPPAEPKRARQRPGPGARRRTSHDDDSCSRGPKGPTRSAPFGAPTFWVPGAASGVCVGQPLMIFVVQPSPAALQPSGRPPPPPQGAAPWAACSPAVTAPGQPGQGAILPPGQPETHIPRWPESPYGEGTAPPLEPQPQAPSLPSSTSLLDELLAATGVPGTQAPSPGAAADEGWALPSQGHPAS
ncbi:double homeobox protein 4-like protein 4, partial [Bos javanicus]|uniref:double homeobox protein 4-like protein 4 n=1 Tax=Bos javanicus TaxID=9906 RepID=UPI002AA5F115